jgi:small subunit ribosomal protein S6
MPFYESIFITRQDVSISDVTRITAELTKIIQDNQGEVIKKEQWGLRDLAYPMNKNNKGYYTLMGISASDKTMKLVERKAKLHEDIIRHVTFKVDQIDTNPSPIIAGDDEN